LPIVTRAQSKMTRLDWAAGADNVLGHIEYLYSYWWVRPGDRQRDRLSPREKGNRR
jgi:hypothetical protein